MPAMPLDNGILTTSLTIDTSVQKGLARNS